MTSEEGESPSRTKDFLVHYKLPLILGGGSVVCLFLSLLFLFRSVYSSRPIEFKTADRTVEQFASVSGMTSIRGIVVDVAGAVQTPGVYTLPIGSRVEDALNAAGGVTKNADTVYVTKVLNRAAKAVDGGKIYVPRAGENETSDNVEILSRRRSTSDNIYTTGLVSINRATQSELESLSGIGPATATKIISGRPYQTLDEVVTKKAMSRSLFDTLKSQLTL